jgi:hypothetical protein
MGRKPRKIEEIEPPNEISGEANPGETLEDWSERMEALEDERDAQLQSDPRHKRKVKKPPKWMESYDPNLGVN